MSQPLVQFELRDEVAVLRMDDGKANALSMPMLEALDAAFDRAEQEASAVALFGRPGRFCAGFDLKVMLSGAEAARALVLAGSETFMRIYAHPQPVVAGCTGHAIAGGVLLAAVCDTRIGVEGDFKLGLNEVPNAMPLPIFAHELARDRLDRRALVQATFQGTLYDPRGAKEAGWLDEVVAPEALEEAALKEAGRLATLPAKAYGISKRSVRRRTLAYVRETLVANMDEFSIG